MENKWIHKYKPTSSADLVGNDKSIGLIKTWLQNFYNEDNEDKAVNMIVIGPHGVGKKTIISTVLTDYGYNIETINFNNLKNNKNIDEYIISLLKGKSIYNIMYNTPTSEKRALVIEDLESITSTVDKKILDTIRKYNTEHKYLPIIYISNTQHTKFISVLKKNCKIITLYQLRKNECLIQLNKIINAEKLKITDNIKYRIVDYSQGDIRKLINIIEDIYILSDNKNITEDIADEYFNNSKMKEINIGLFQATEKLFVNYSNYDNILGLYEVEKNKLPLMVHEHYQSHINNNYTNKKVQIKKLKKISNLLSFGDYIEYHIYNDQDWDMYEYHGFYSCIATSYHINNGKKFNKPEKYNFPQDLNKTSIKNINRKNIQNIENIFKNNNIYDYLQMSKILSILLNKNNNKEIGDLIKKYKINIMQFESLLKIDKIIKTKNICISTKNKKELLKYL
jgi:DNA polymerase III delta prime subunit